MEQNIVYRNEWGSDLSTLTDFLEKPVKIYKGNIFSTRDDSGRKTLYSIEHVEEKDLSWEVTVREIKPKGYKALLLVAGLAGSWYAIKYLLVFLGM